MHSPGVLRWYRGREAPSCWPCSSRGPAIQLLAPQKALVVPFGREGRGSEKERDRVAREEEDEEEEKEEAAVREEEEEEEEVVEVENRRESSSPSTLVGRSVGRTVGSVGRCVCRKYTGSERGTHGRIIYSHSRKRPMNNAPEPPMCRTVR